MNTSQAAADIRSRGGTAARKDMDELLSRSLQAFLRWLASNGRSSYDQYDFWASGFGRFAKRQYYRINMLGAAFVAPVVLLDMLLPESRALIAEPSRFPIADAHLIMGMIRYAEASTEKKWLADAEQIGNELIGESIEGYAGHCWGYPFDWETVVGLFRRGMPLITTTPYCYEAFCMLHEATGNETYRAIAASSVQFALYNIPQREIRPGVEASSYSPADRSKVINANAYRAMMLADAFGRFGIPECQEAANRNIAYVLEHQEEDGSWPYEVDSEHNRFVDNFHTCFVLKNLFKANRVLQRADVADALRKGYRFYRAHLIGPDGLPKPFARVPHFAPTRLEVYDVAEGIALGVLLRDMIPEAYDVAAELAMRAVQSLQLRDGHFLTRISRFGIRNEIPYLRWPQAQMFHALAFIYQSSRS